METILTTILSRSAKILRRVLETGGKLLLHKLHGKPSANAGVNNFQRNKKNKYQSLLENRKTNKLWNMKVTITPILIGALGTVTKGLIQGLENLEIKGRVETIQTTVLLRSTRILRRVLET